MSDAIIDRLAKLHEDACSCQDEYRRAKETIETESDFSNASQILNSLADKQRLTIVRLVQRYGALCSCEIESAFDLAHSTMIHHLRNLTEAGILVTHKKGKWSYYQLSASLPAQIQQLAVYLSAAKGNSIMMCCCTTETLTKKGSDQQD